MHHGVVPGQLEAAATPPISHLLILGAPFGVSLCRTILSSLLLGYPVPVVGPQFNQDDHSNHGQLLSLLNFLNTPEVHEHDLVLAIYSPEAWFQLPASAFALQYAAESSPGPLILYNEGVLFGSARLLNVVVTTGLEVCGSMSFTQLSQTLDRVRNNQRKSAWSFRRTLTYNLRNNLRRSDGFFQVVSSESLRDIEYASMPQKKEKKLDTSPFHTFETPQLLNQPQGNRPYQTSRLTHNASLDKLPEDSWSSVRLATNRTTRKIPYLLQPSASIANEVFEKMWYYPYTRALLRQCLRYQTSPDAAAKAHLLHPQLGNRSYSRQGGAGGVWMAEDGTWKSWEEVCPDFEFGDGLGEWGREGTAGGLVRNWFGLLLAGAQEDEAEKEKAEGDRLGEVEVQAKEEAEAENQA
ncbi:hypothetical protein K402DRAFT_398933 [Aulographum hederae CBS 113979]|uniref:Uncharacterized protein n=1 Tax=Aulographum hederae CBS 113979 TaxID=1176131 RepID=A0A6G1GJB6_9PEZI|nr:hypothetical protein K402DRAFT_398933 [Aulographum hederae CBS 113979]